MWCPHGQQDCGAAAVAAAADDVDDEDWRKLVAGLCGAPTASKTTGLMMMLMMKVGGSWLPVVWCPTVSNATGLMMMMVILVVSAPDVWFASLVLGLFSQDH